MGCLNSTSAEVIKTSVKPEKTPETKSTSIKKTSEPPKKRLPEEAVKIKGKAVLGCVDPTQNLKLDNFTFSDVNFAVKNVNKYYKKQSPPQNGSDWQDPLFPHTSASILSQEKDGSWIDKDSSRRIEGSLSSQVGQIAWKKAKEIFKGEPLLFEGKMDIDYLKQGSLGNYYFLAAISAMAENPQTIAQLFPFFEVDRGYFEVVLKIDGDFKKVLIDDYFPVDKRNDKPFFVKPKGNELWAMVLEKAWAKVNGGYLNTAGGVSRDVLCAFTPFPSKRIFHWASNKQDQADLFNELVRAMKSNSILTSSSGQSKQVEALGLIPGQACTLLSAVEHKGVRLIKLHNPWGAAKWKGNWSENSSKWTPEMKQAVGYTESDRESVFFIELSDFVKHFKNTEVCIRTPKICSKTRKIKKKESHLAQVTSLTVFNDCTLYLQFSRKSWRFHREIESTDYLPQILILGKKNENGNGFSIVGASTDPTDNCIIEKEVKKGEYVIWSYVDHSNGKMPKQTAYNVNVSSSDYFKLESLAKDSDSTFLKNLLFGEAKKSSSGNDLCHYENIKIEGSNLFVKTFVNKHPSSSVKITVDSSKTYNYCLFGENLNGESILTPGSEAIIYGWVKNIGYGAFCSVSASWTIVSYKDEHTEKNVQLVQPTFSPGKDKTVTSAAKDYHFLFKEVKLDYFSMLSRIEPVEANWSYFSKKYPDLVKSIAALDLRVEDNVILQDKCVFSDGSFYFGEWDRESNVRRGRAVYDFGNGTKHVGYWSNDVFEGSGTIYFGKDDWVKANFVEGRIDGEGFQRHPNGKETKLLFEIDTFVRYV